MIDSEVLFGCIASNEINGVTSGKEAVVAVA
jgi:hypothetical protein